MNVIEILAYLAAGLLLAFRIGMLVGFVLLPVIIFRMVRRPRVVRSGAPASK